MVYSLEYEHFSTYTDHVNRWGRCQSADGSTENTSKEATILSCKSVLTGSVPSGSGGGAFSTGLWHHASHRCLHPLRFYRRRQDPTDASHERQRITMGEEGIYSSCCYLVKNVLDERISGNKISVIVRFHAFHGSHEYVRLPPFLRFPLTDLNSTVWLCFSVN